MSFLSQFTNTVGTGGTTLTGSVTLTVGSDGAMSVTPTAPGHYATLPVATTCVEAAGLFAIYNAGEFDYGVKDSAGTQLGWVRPRTGALIGLANNSTAAGVWTNYGLEKLGITANYANATINNMTTDMAVVTLDANRTCFVFGGGDCYAIVYDASTQVWGSATLVRATIFAHRAVLSATNQVLVVSCNTTTAMEAVTLTISGTTITVNSGTKGTATLATNFAAMGKLLAVSTSWVIAHGRSAPTVSSIRAITVSGTTPTIGAEAAIVATTTTPPNIYASGSIVRTVVATSTLMTCTPFTVSGSTLTLGTGATVTTTDAQFRAFVNGNGNIVAQYKNAGNTHGAVVFKLTSTTEAASTVVLGAFPSQIVANSDYVQVTAGKTAFFSGNTGSWSANLLTDTAGTASVGTERSGVTAGIPTCSGLPPVGNNASFVVLDSNSAFTTRTFDCSGASLTATGSYRMAFASGEGYIPPPTDAYGLQGPGGLIVGQSVYNVPSSANGAGKFSEQLANLSPLRPPICGFMVPGVGAGSVGYATGVLHSPVGIYIQKVEAAA